MRPHHPSSTPSPSFPVPHRPAPSDETKRPRTSIISVATLPLPVCSLSPNTRITGPCRVPPVRVANLTLCPGVSSAALLQSAVRFTVPASPNLFSSHEPAISAPYTVLSHHDPVHILPFFVPISGSPRIQPPIRSGQRSQTCRVVPLIPHSPHSQQTHVLPIHTHHHHPSPPSPPRTPTAASDTCDPPDIVLHLPTDAHLPFSGLSPPPRIL